MQNDEKNLLRGEYKERRRAIPAGERAERDRRIIERVMGLISYRYAGTVMLYEPKAGEIDTRPLAQAARAAGKRTAYPVTLDGEKGPGPGRMEFRLVDDPARQLRPGRFGLMEPTDDCLRFRPRRGDGTLMILPALAIDRNGWRLGYGRGYYDRYLERFPDVLTLGLTYFEFVAANLPHGRHDRAVDLIVTERGVKAIAQKESR